MTDPGEYGLLLKELCYFEIFCINCTRVLILVFPESLHFENTFVWQEFTVWNFSFGLMKIAEKFEMRRFAEKIKMNT